MAEQAMSSMDATEVSSDRYSVNHERGPRRFRTTPLPSEASELIDEWCRHQLLGRGFSTKTVDRRRWSLSILGEFLDAHHCPLVECTTELLEEWLCSYRSVQTRYTLRSDVKQFFSWAVRRDRAPADPTAVTDAPRLPKRLPRPLSTRQVQELLGSTSGSTRLMILLATHAGLRVSEIAALTGDDVYDGCVHVLSGKGGRDRTIPMSVELQQAVADTGTVASGVLFPSNPTGASVSARIRKAMRDIGINKRVHDLRHSFGTELARRNVPITVIAQVMGHSSLSTTQGYILLAAPDASMMANLYASVR